MTDKTLIITGASKGIGAAIAAVFASEGWRVYSLSRSRPNPSVIPAGDLSQVTHLEVDLAQITSFEAAESILAPLAEVRGEICLCHNAAQYLGGPITELDIAAVKTSFDVNLFAPMLLNLWLLKRMTAGSSIIYIGSTLSEKAVRAAAPYVVAKHALLGLMRSTCQDLMGSGVHTCLVCPGTTDTEMLRSHLGSPEAIAQLTALNSYQRLVEPREIADLVFFAAKSPSLNGAVLHANLGQKEL